MSSLGAAKKLLKDRHLRPFLLMHPKALPEFDDTPQQDPNAVVVGLAMEAFSFDNMNSAFRVLLDDPEAPLIAIHKVRLQLLCPTACLVQQEHKGRGCGWMGEEGGKLQRKKMWLDRKGRGVAGGGAEAGGKLGNLFPSGHDRERCVF